MSEQKPNWVAMQAACQIDAVFEDLLKAVEQDVDTMKTVPPEQRGPCQYKYTKQYDHQAIVFRTDEFGDNLSSSPGSSVPMAVIFERAPDGQSIQIRQHLMQGNENHNVTLRWNAEKVSCELVWGDEKDPREVWQVSQKALAPLFFGPDSAEV